ncbi:hypothetical protein ISS37_05155 [candidate division KSB1 bacterium]|nr:hypothetical protein [candidate division KSB1 bacterium]
MESMGDKKKLEFRNNIFCKECHSVLKIEDLTFQAYFHSDEITCAYCKQKLDLWDCLKTQIDHILVSFGWHYGLLGCKGRNIKILLKPNELHKLDLSKEIGDGELLHINYTPTSGDLFPIQMHSNKPITHLMPKVINLIPYAVKENPSNTEVNIFYWFAAKEVKEDLSTMLLLDAFRRFYEENYRHMLVSAQTSIEILQYKFLNELLKSTKICEERIKSFLEYKATFSVQLFTLMPFLSKIMKFPIPAPQVIKGFKNLVDDRNDVIHRGIPEKVWNKNRLQNELLSAFILFKYFRIIHKVF